MVLSILVSCLLGNLWTLEGKIECWFSYQIFHLCSRYPACHFLLEANCWAWRILSHHWPGLGHHREDPVCWSLQSSHWSWQEAAVAQIPASCASHLCWLPRSHLSYTDLWNIQSRNAENCSTTEELRTASDWCYGWVLLHVSGTKKPTKIIIITVLSNQCKFADKFTCFCAKKSWINTKTWIVLQIAVKVA